MKNLKTPTIEPYFADLYERSTSRQCVAYVFNVRLAHGDQPCPTGCGKNISDYNQLQKRAAFQCSRCRNQIYPLANTVLNRMKKANIFFQQLHDAVVSKQVVPAIRSKQDLEVSYNTAVNYNARILRLMKDATKVDKLIGDISVDEMDLPVHTGFVRKETLRDRKILDGDKKTDRKKNRILLFGLVEKNGRAVCEIIPNKKAETLTPIIKRYCDPLNTKIVSDHLKSYDAVVPHGYTHVKVKGGNAKFVVGGKSTNPVENYWSNVLHTLSPCKSHSAHKVREKLYVHNFHHNFRKLSNKAKMKELMLLLPPFNFSEKKILTEYIKAA